MTEQQTQGTVLAVHTSQLTRDNMSQLAAQGYGILPDQSGWLIFVRVPQATGDGRQATDGLAQDQDGASAPDLAPDDRPRAPAS